MSTHYRSATHADHRAIAELHAVSWRHTYRGAYRDEFLDGPVFADRRAVWEQRLSDPAPNQFVVVAEEDGQIVGFACAYGRNDEVWGTLLDNIHVRPEFHRRRFGTGLVSEVARWCLARYPDCGLWLWVVGQNERARRFYERLGAIDHGAELRPPSVGGGEPRAVHRYAWARLDRVAVSLRTPAVERRKQADERGVQGS